MTVTFSLPPAHLEVYNFVEITASVDAPAFSNPFTQVEFAGVFGLEDRLTQVPVDGFCDSPDGSTFRIRFMPRQPGTYTYVVTLRTPDGSFQSRGQFAAIGVNRKGLLRVDPEHPFHFIWEGSGQHYFYNSTTTYALLGLREDILTQSLERLHSLRINRLRVALSPARVESGMAWHEPVYPSDEFTFCFGPWVAARPNDLENPGWDTTRFDLDFWRKCERMLRYTRDREMLISIIFYLDGARPGVYPFGLDGMGGLDEQRYYRYAAARLSAFSNVTWDVSNEYQNFLSRPWVERMGAFLKACDPYDHLASVHGHETFEFGRFGSGWADFAMFQTWDESGAYDFMLEKRRIQEQAGRPMPVINEEYGYEDHYPQWGGGRQSPERSADNRRKLAWEMAMAGAYQTTGELAGNGLGGWINGRGDETMNMLPGYAKMMDFFTSFDWWLTEPRPDLAGPGTRVLASPDLFALYTVSTPVLALQAQPGRYRLVWYNPRTGSYAPDQEITHPGGPLTFQTPNPGEDAACLLRKIMENS
jgi:hypothetical protein